MLIYGWYGLHPKSHTLLNIYYYYIMITTKKENVLYSMNLIRTLTMSSLSCDLQCRFTAFHKSFPVASWDTKVSIVCTLRICPEVLGHPLFWTLWIQRYSSHTDCLPTIWYFVCRCSLDQSLLQCKYFLPMHFLVKGEIQTKKMCCNMH